jgi:replicative DNA helicase
MTPGTGTAIGRIPPQNLEVEQHVLGSMLLDRRAVVEVRQQVGPEDFYRDRHRLIYTAMLDLADRREPVDLATVTNALRVAGKLEDVGGAVYLAELPGGGACPGVCGDRAGDIPVALADRGGGAARGCGL